MNLNNKTAYSEIIKTLPLAMNIFFFESGGEDKDSKTEDATDHKKKKARGEGQVAKSQEISTCLTLILMFSLLRALGGWLYDKVLGLMHYDFGRIPFAHDMLSSRYMADYVSWMFGQVVLIATPLLFASFLAGVISNLWQVGWHPTSKPMMPKPKKLNPISGFKRMFSMQSIINLIKSLLKLAVVGIVVYVTLMGRLEQVSDLLYMGLANAFAVVSLTAVDLAIRVGVVFVIVAILDYWWVTYKHKKDLRMTKQEVKDEWKQLDGDPKIKQKIRQKMVDASMRRMMSNVPEADVVITNPTHYAVAIRYNNKIDKAPIVVAKGVDFLAKRIREKAMERGVVIVPNPPLARSVYERVEVGEEIPFEMWEAVVEVLAYVYKLKNRVA